MTCTELKRWAVGERWAIVKTRDESDGEIGYEVFDRGVFDDAYDCLESARTHIRGAENQERLDRINDLLADVDLDAKGTASKLAAVLRFLEK